METKHKVEAITDHSVKILRIFLNALEKFEGPYLFGKAELAYIHDQFSVWLKGNEDCIVRLHQLVDAGGSITDGKALSDIYHEMKSICHHAENFDMAFTRLCQTREVNGTTSVEALFETAGN